MKPLKFLSSLPQTDVAPLPSIQNLFRIKRLNIWVANSGASTVIPSTHVVAQENIDGA